METVQYATRAEWLDARRRGLGASDAAVVLGLSKWKSPFNLYAEKVGLLAPSPEELEWMEWGRRLEPVIAQKYEDDTGRQTRDLGDYALTTGDEPWLIATLDREVLADHTPNKPLAPLVPGVLELKNAIEYKRDEWAEEPPLEYQVQLQHQLAVTGYSWGSLAVLIGGRAFLWTDMDRNDRFIAKLLEHEAAFWQRVVREQPPEPDASKATADALAALFPKEGIAELVRLGGEDALELDNARMAAKLESEKLKTVLDECDNKLKALIGANVGCVMPNGAIYTWKHQSRAGYTVAPTEFRVLRRSPVR